MGKWVGFLKGEVLVKVKTEDGGRDPMHAQIALGIRLHDSYFN